ncbi:MAG: MlaD family protein [Planctomycetota bacterium]|jgi:paraquat-inducible protein B
MAQTNHAKLGFFVLTAVVLAAATFVWLAASRLKQETFEIVTYLDESVQGLDVGSSVKFRGVPIGTVKRIGITSEALLVRVEMSLLVDRLAELSLPLIKDEDGEFHPDHLGPAGLRTQLASSGITGVKYIAIDLHSDSNQVEVALGFPPPANFVPNTPSTLKSIETAVWVVLEAIPDMTRRMEGLLQRIDDLALNVDATLDTTDISGMVESIIELTDNASELAERLDRDLTELDVKRLGDSAVTTLEEAQAAIAELRQAVREMRGPEGALGRVTAAVDRVAADAQSLMRSVEQTVSASKVDETTAALRGTANAWTGVARDSASYTERFDRSLRELEETLRSVRDLADRLERDPGALIRGGGSGYAPPRPKEDR